MNAARKNFPIGRASRRRSAGRGLLVLPLLFAFAACSLGPDYHRPDTPTPGQWKQAGAAAAWPSADWWQSFDSSRLNQLMEQARHANDDIAVAVAQVREADAQARIAGAPLLPSLDAGFQASRARTMTSGGPETSNLFSPTLAASYEVDFWGRNRATLRAAEATADASRFDRATVELTVMASVANTYFEALALRDRLGIAQHNLDTAEAVLKDLKLEQRVGTANALDVAQQAVVAATAEAAVPPLQQQLRQTVDALAVLTGGLPEALDVDRGGLADLSRPQVTPGLPSQLLARRPDVAAAEAQLVAANANVAAARAAWFPNIGLTASGGYASPALSDLFNPANAIFALGAGATQTLFDGGALAGQSDYARSRYAELLADYHKAVISAFANVEDALVALQQTDQQEQRQQQASAAAHRAYDFAQAQLHAGTINVLTLLNTETAVFTADDALAQVRLAHLQALVNLFSALGGGWQQASVPKTS